MHAQRSGKRRSVKDPAHQRAFREVFARSRNPMLIAVDARRYVDANGPACALLGLPREEVLRRTISDFTPPHALDQLEDMWAVFSVTDI